MIYPKVCRCKKRGCSNVRFFNQLKIYIYINGGKKEKTERRKNGEIGEDKKEKAEK